MIHADIAKHVFARLPSLILFVADHYIIKLIKFVLVFLLPKI